MPFIADISGIFHFSAAYADHCFVQYLDACADSLTSHDVGVYILGLSTYLSPIFI